MPTSNVFGPRQDLDSEYAAVIPEFLQGILNRQKFQVFGDGSQTRDFTYIDNVVHANVAASTRPDAAGQVLNISCGESWSLMELPKLLEVVLQRDASVVHRERRVGDVKHSLASIEKAKRLLGYSPTIDFDEGIRKTAAWFQEFSNTRPSSAMPPASRAGGMA